MKILIIGATGIIGKPLYNSLKNQHEVFGASRSSTQYTVDTRDKHSVSALFEKLPKLDAVINAAGHGTWKTFDQMTEEDYYAGIKDKLMGQVNLVHIASSFLNPNGAIILTTGILADYPEHSSTGLALINGALHSFVMAAAPQLKDNIRLNVVSPGAVESFVEDGELFAGHKPLPVEAVIKVYKEALESQESGKVYRIY